MIVTRPSFGAIVALVAFVIACFAATIYMWIQFGGPIPMKPESYRMNIAFKEARGLVKGTDVRIAGINIGKVGSAELDPETNETIVEIEVDDEFSPRPTDTTAVLRQKSLLGEPYIELSAGSADAPDVPEDGTLPAGTVEESVVFEDLLSTFDPQTRAALTSMLTSQGGALQGSAPYFSWLLSTMPDFAINIDEALEVVRQQDDETAMLLREGGGALTALTERQGQLQGLVQNTSRVFRATAARNEELADAITILPTFIDETVKTSDRFADFSEDTAPLFTQLVPAARELSPVLKDLRVVSPPLRTFMRGIKPLTSASKQGGPALGRFLDEIPPFLEVSTPWFGRMIPVLDYANAYRREAVGAIANLGSASQTTAKPVAQPGQLHYVRSALPTSLESLGAFPQRFGTSRSNPYPAPGSALEVTGGLPQFADYLCVNRTLPSFTAPPWDDVLVNGDPLSGLPAEREPTLPYYYTDVLDDPNPVDPPAPPCRSQAPLGPSLNAGTGVFPELGTLP